MTSLRIVQEDHYTDLLDRVKRLKTKADQAAKEFETAQAGLIALMDDREIFEVDSDDWHATKVAGQTMTVDDRGLMSWLRQVNPRVLNEVTKTVIDKAKLGEAINRDEISMEVVNKYMTTKPKKSYLLITERKNDPDAQ